MTMYAIRTIRNGNVQLSVFSDRKEPDDVYTITAKSCSCPSPKYPCKHMPIVKHWKTLPGNGWVFDTETSKWTQPFSTDILNRFFDTETK